MVSLVKGRPERCGIRRWLCGACHIFPVRCFSGSVFLSLTVSLPCFVSLSVFLPVSFSIWMSLSQSLSLVLPLITPSFLLCALVMPSYWHACVLSHISSIRLCATSWTVARQAPLSVEFSRQEYWSGLPFLSPGDLPDPGIEPVSLTSPALAGGFFTTSTTWEALKLPQSATFSHSHGCCMTCLSSSQEHWYLCALPRFLPAFLSFRSQFKCHLILWRA